MNPNLILNIPHASTVIKSEDVPWTEILSASSIYWNFGGHGRLMHFRFLRYQEELLYMTDWYTDELFDNGVGVALKAPVSRLICDMERFRDPEQEPM